MVGSGRTTPTSALSPRTSNRTLPWCRRRAELRPARAAAMPSDYRILSKCPYWRPVGLVQKLNQPRGPKRRIRPGAQRPADIFRRGDLSSGARSGPIRTRPMANEQSTFNVICHDAAARWQVAAMAVNRRLEPPVDAAARGSDRRGAIARCPVSPGAAIRRDAHQSGRILPAAPFGGESIAIPGDLRLTRDRFSSAPWTPRAHHDRDPFAGFSLLPNSRV